MAKLLMRNGKLLMRGGKLLFGPACCYRQARDCSTEELIDKWAKVEDVTLGVAYCADPDPFYFSGGDPVSMCPGTIVDLSELDTAETCEECEGGGHDCIKCGNCCISDQSTVDVSWTLGTILVDDGGDCFSTSLTWEFVPQAIIDKYFPSGSIAGIPYVGLEVDNYHTWRQTVDTYQYAEGWPWEETVNVIATVKKNCDTGHWIIDIRTDGHEGSLWYIHLESFDLVTPHPCGIEADVEHDCCGASGTWEGDINTGDSSGFGEVYSAVAATVELKDNHCCQDEDGACQKQAAADCAGGCSGEEVDI